MGYLPNREHDIFISYAHIDDVTSKWVTNFTRFLNTELQRQLRIKESSIDSIPLKIWKDDKLPQHGDVSKRLEETVTGASTLLVVMSGSYLLSDWCKKEGIQFVNSLKEKSDLRIFIVEREFTEKDDWPDFLKGQDNIPLLSRPFFDDTDIGGIRIIPMTTPQGDIDPRAGRILEDFCNDYSSFLFDLKRNPPPVETGDANRFIYVASCHGSDAEIFRNSLVKKLGNGTNAAIEIIPKTKIKKPSEMDKSLTEDLPNCELFVQILDKEPGFFDHKLGLAGYQYEAAVQCNIPILHWVCPDLKEDEIDDEHYKKFVKDVRAGTTPGKLIKGELDDLKTEIEKEIKEQKPNVERTRKQTCFITLRSDVSDNKIAEEIKSKIKTKKYDFAVHVLTADNKTTPKDMETLMKYAKGVIIVWGNIELDWVLRQIESFESTPGRAAKCGAVALLDPPNNSEVFDDSIVAINLSAENIKKKSRKDELPSAAESKKNSMKNIASYMDRLSELMIMGEETLH